MNSLEEKKQLLSKIHGEREAIRAKLTELSAVMPKIETPKIREMICQMLKLLEELERLYGTACDSVLDDHELSFCECHKKSEKLWGEIHALDERLCEMLDGGKRRKVSKPCPEQAFEKLKSECEAILARTDRHLAGLEADGVVDFVKACNYHALARCVKIALERRDFRMTRQFMREIYHIGSLARPDAYRLTLSYRIKLAWRGLAARLSKWARRWHQPRNQKPSNGIISIRLP